MTDIANKRTNARLIFVQSLYQYSFWIERDLQQDLLQITQEIIVLHKDELIDKELLSTLVNSLPPLINDIDEAIAKYLTKNIAPPRLVRQILRSGVFELRFMQEIPTNVILNEYADLAGAFYGKSQVGLVSAILQKISSERI